MNKNVLASKTFWFGLISALAPLVPSVGAFVGNNPELVASIWGGLAIVLRLVTKDKVKLLP